MAARGITESEVKAVVADPDITSPGRSTPERGATKVLWKTVNERRLKVVVTDTDPPGREAKCVTPTTRK